MEKRRKHHHGKKKKAQTQERQEDIQEDSHQRKADQHQPEANERRNQTVKIYAIKDEQVGFRSIMEFKNDGEAARAFMQMQRTTDNLIGQWPGDFSLWKIAEYSEESGEVKPQEGGPTLLMRGNADKRK
ncbi:nonstructural protein [Sigmofec virus UA08Rod_5306]|uniref:Nonstructural protein n=1 Tax=Sigmofec virus UA08Rod_5306 TaxID=2929417 RepID=A0A976R5B5_9VIRU|nr:nonstructural protein [Sigmofec virus UA08Rod_5306]